METRLPFIVLVVSASVAFVFNVRGAMFSGSAGAYSASLFVALSAIAVYRESVGSLPAEIPALWFYLPVLDCLRLFAQRMMAGRSPFSADRNHFHHVLLEDMTPAIALIAYLLFLSLPGLLALYDLQLGSIALLVCVGAYALLVMRAKARKGAAVN